MSKLPVLSGQEVVKALLRIGYAYDHQRGSHIILRQTSPPHRRITIPNHKALAKGTLRSIVHEVGLTIEEFTELL